MKKIFLLLLFPIVIYAAATKLSDVLPAQNFYIDLEPGECNTRCLLSLLKKGQFFSFLARFNDKFANDEIKKKYSDFINGNFDYLQTIVNTPTFAPSNTNKKIAILIPQKTIKSYSVIVSNAILAYSATLDNPIYTQFFLFDDEKNIKNVLDNILENEFSYVIAPITDAAINDIIDDKYNKIFFYIPTLNAKLANINKSNILFGGIDYESQIDALLSKANGKVVSISDGSKLGDLLNNYVFSKNNSAYLSVINTKDVDLKTYLKGKLEYQNANIFVNTTLFKTSLLSAQFRVYDVGVKQILCTQICYDPVLFSLTQESDLSNMLVAVSFNDIDANLLANAELLNIDLKYDRVAYPVMFGLDYIITSFLDKGEQSYFNEVVNNNQVQYKTQLFKIQNKHFIKVK